MTQRGPGVHGPRRAAIGPLAGSADFINAVQTLKDTEHNHHIDNGAHQKETNPPACMNLYSSERQIDACLQRHQLLRNHKEPHGRINT